MQPNLRAHPFSGAAVALSVALAGCATATGPGLTVSDDTRARIAQALQASGDSANAAAALGVQSVRTTVPAADPLTHATALIAAGQVDKGMAEAKAALAARDGDLAVALEVGRLAIRSGRLAAAHDVYAHLLARDPDNVEALNGDGVVLAQQGDPVGAAGMFRRALVLRPQDVPARNNLALVMALSGETGVAVSMLETLDRTDGSQPVKATLALARAEERMNSAGQNAAGQNVAGQNAASRAAP